MRSELSACVSNTKHLIVGTTGDVPRGNRFPCVIVEQPEDRHVKEYESHPEDHHCVPARSAFSWQVLCPSSTRAESVIFDESLNDHRLFVAILLTERVPNEQSPLGRVRAPPPKRMMGGRQHQLPLSGAAFPFHCGWCCSPPPFGVVGRSGPSRWLGGLVRALLKPRLFWVLPRLCHKQQQRQQGQLG